MDLRRFNKSSPGDLVEIARGEYRGERAFLPHPLPPPDWSASSNTWRLIAEAMHELGRLDGATTSLPDPGILLRPLENREALRSSSLEGTYATPRELLLFELPDNAPETASREHVNAWREVNNYRNALQQSSGDSVIDAPLHLIRQLHQTLMRDVRGSDRTPGAFRTDQVFIGSEHRFTPPPPEHVMLCLEGLESFIKNPNPEIHPLVRAFLAHYQFETIHPFGDGNGRVGRLLMTIMIRELCGHRRPWLYLSAFFDQFKDEYIDRLFTVSTSNAWDQWVDFCLRATIAQARDTFDRCTKLLALREEYRRTVAAKPRLSRIVDMLFENPIMRTTSLATTLKITYPTAQRDVEQLVNYEIIRELGTVYPKTHYAPRIYGITFYEPDQGTPSIDK